MAQTPRPDSSRATLRELIRKHGKRRPPQFTVVMRRQFRLEGLKQYRVVF